MAILTSEQKSLCETTGKMLFLTWESDYQMCVESRISPYPKFDKLVKKEFFLIVHVLTLYGNTIMRPFLRIPETVSLKICFDMS